MSSADRSIDLDTDTWSLIVFCVLMLVAVTAATVEHARTAGGRAARTQMDGRGSIDSDIGPITLGITTFMPPPPTPPAGSGGGGAGGLVAHATHADSSLEASLEIHSGGSTRRWAFAGFTPPSGPPPLDVPGIGVAEISLQMDPPAAHLRISAGTDTPGIALEGGQVRIQCRFTPHDDAVELLSVDGASVSLIITEHHRLDPLERAVLEADFGAPASTSDATMSNVWFSAGTRAGSEGHASVLRIVDASGPSGRSASFVWLPPDRRPDLALTAERSWVLDALQDATAIEGDLAAVGTEHGLVIGVVDRTETYSKLQGGPVTHAAQGSGSIVSRRQKELASDRVALLPSEVSSAYTSASPVNSTTSDALNRVGGTVEALPVPASGGGHPTFDLILEPKTSYQIELIGGDGTASLEHTHPSPAATSFSGVQFSMNVDPFTGVFVNREAAPRDPATGRPTVRPYNTPVGQPDRIMRLVATPPATGNAYLVVWKWPNDVGANVLSVPIESRFDVRLRDDALVSAPVTEIEHRVTVAFEHDSAGESVPKLTYQRRVD